jgi:hypothetical protein
MASRTVSVSKNYFHSLNSTNFAEANCKWATQLIIEVSCDN